MDTHELNLPPNYQEIIDRFIAACQADDRILAAFIGGSYATGKVDKFSDLDLFFITTDAAYEDFFTERERFVRLLGEPLVQEGFGHSDGYCLIFSNMAECDLWFGHESNFKDINSGPYKILLDKKGILEGAVFPTPVPAQARQVELLGQQLDWFWHDLNHFIKAMGRRQLWFAHGELDTLRQYCVNLARLRYNFFDAYAGEEPYFKIERALPVEQLSALQTTFCAMEYEAILQAALVIFRFYRDLAPQLAEEHQLRYHADLERELGKHLEALGDEGSR